MKMCPCCKSLTFEDMDRCYVCDRPFARSALERVFGGGDDTPSWSPDYAIGEAPSARDFSQLGEVCAFTVDSSFVEDERPKAPSAGWLVQVEQPGKKEAQLRLHGEGEQICVGRATDNQVRIPDLHVSRHHARLSVLDGALWLSDLGSTNLTLLDGVPLVGTRKLKERATVRIGCATLQVTKEGCGVS